MPIRLRPSLARLLAGALDAFLPPRCLACLGPAWEGGEAGLCRGCSGLMPAPVPRCPRCARRAGALVGAPGCPACAGPLAAPDALGWPDPETRPGPLAGAITAWTYADTPRQLVLGLKFGARLRAAGLLGDGLTEALLRRECPGDLLVPVPLSKQRFRERGFNQATQLARVVGRSLRVQVDVRALRRRRHTERQTTLSRRGRLVGPRGAFAASPARVQGRVVILVDDVLTSGATARACALALRRAGAVRVIAAVACRAE